MRFFKTRREKEFVIKRLAKGRLIPLLKYIVYRTHLSHFFTLHRKHYAMHVWYAPLAFWLWTREEKSKSDESFYESFLTEGDVVIDCGAHLGTLTMTASKLVGKEGYVIACEMHPRIFSYLAQNIKDNKLANVTCINTAIGDKEGKVSITDEYVSDINHIHNEGSLFVPITTLDAVAKNLSRIKLIKLDIEGYELQALAGARETLPKTDAIYFEAAERNFNRYGYSLQNILEFLEDRGFSCFRFDENNVRHPITKSYMPKVKFENILAVRI